MRPQLLYDGAFRITTHMWCLGEAIRLSPRVYQTPQSQMDLCVCVTREDLVASSTVLFGAASGHMWNHLPIIRWGCRFAPHIPWTTYLNAVARVNKRFFPQPILLVEYESRRMCSYVRICVCLGSDKFCSVAMSFSWWLEKKSLHMVQRKSNIYRSYVRIVCNDFVREGDDDDPQNFIVRYNKQTPSNAAHRQDGIRVVAVRETACCHVYDTIVEYEVVGIFWGWFAIERSSGGLGWYCARRERGNEYICAGGSRGCQKKRLLTM